MDRSGDITFTVRKKELELEKLRMQIADLEKTIARPADENIRHYTAFEFFKGFLIASFIVTAVLALPTILYVQISNFLYKAGEYDYSYPELKAILFLAGIFALIHLIGGFVARKRRDANNASADKLGKISEMLASLYNSGDLDTKGIITYDLLNSVESDEKFEKLIGAFSDTDKKVAKAARKLREKNIKAEKPKKTHNYIADDLNSAR